MFLAWAPYLLLVIFVLLWGIEPVKTWLNAPTATFGWPGLHNQILRIPPVVARRYRLIRPVHPQLALCFRDVLPARCLRFRVAAGSFAAPRHLPAGRDPQTLAFPILTVVVVLGMAFLMNYWCHRNPRIGLASTHGLFPFFGTLLGWLGVFFTGSDTSSNALFGNLQVVTANS